MAAAELLVVQLQGLCHCSHPGTAAATLAPAAGKPKQTTAVNPVGNTDEKCCFAKRNPKELLLLEV